ncbi:MAG: quinone-dependent dihydroorotate dehydrogenase [Prevotella sp.]|nr:quinone-dependent dihydroorotate dehydrogenase [Prevotella sp.]MCH4181577.1 quinone-dependent dihydroorotate dehydrogenase [Prevotella sp.]MCH4212136.1 quinone-dependent dihydroorotate dehydrogenase [Prevotella sp.]MCH4241148.1 quinone-dependent dihydroorotate dehydrogenase [Prevotella sp.]
MLYRNIFRPLLFTVNPEQCHRMLVKTLKFYGHIFPLRMFYRKCYHTCNPFHFQGLQFQNRVGLSAGFDKEAQVFDQLSDFGFAFIEIGTITPSPQEGNPCPRIFRTPADQSLISRTGFNNPGVEVVFKRISRNRKHPYILGVNINKDANSTGQQVVKDFEKVFVRLYEVADYFTVNWGSISAEEMDMVLSRLADLRKSFPMHRAIFLKFPADVPEKVLDKGIAMAEHYGLQGFIATGPTKGRDDLKETSPVMLQHIGNGQVSGKGIGLRSLNVVKYLHHHIGKEMLVIGSGNVMTPEDAKKMIKAGADLVEIYSAMIYNGPGIVKKMNKGILSENKIH